MTAGSTAVGDPRRPSGDPVREVMAEHRALCERAVGPLEIAAGLEEAGLGAEAAARCRHADLFSLAEELYARVPRRPPVPPQARDRPQARDQECGATARAALTASALAALPCAAVAGLGVRWPVLLAAAVPLLLTPALTADPPAGPGRPPFAGPVDGDELGPPPAVHHGSGTRWRPAALAYGIGLAALLLLPSATAGRDRPLTVALVLAAALSAGSAERAARWCRQVGRGHLGAAATLAAFRARMRPVLPVAVALHLAVLGVLTFAALVVLTAVAPRGPGHGGGLLHLAAERAGAAEWAAQGVLGLLLVLPAVLARCGRWTAAALGALAGPAATLALLGPVGSGPPAGLLGGGAVAAVLLGYAWAVLGRAEAHRWP
ncbi:hypothetical protein F7Q99_16880 [Streptomyces kaniharaensis]|uniref:Integral membrane protein n=1 Tax=Streptomyces kaniharaensis TaxID=212423 RepID=A0A6N7KU97_9ACTN|nr:hypothetical protein [Streptomyces kaniharaensis]MQS13898.1 hypothetical protein [Streptomyces kaniharaensis]